MSQPGFFFFTGDWLKDTRVLSPEERGCWIDALCFLNEHGGSVTWPIAAFARFWGVSVEAATCVLDAIAMANVGICQWQNDGKTIAKLSNRRILREVEKRNKTKEVRAQAGKKGAAVRWQKCGPSESYLNPSLNPTEEEDTKSARAWPSHSNLGFDQFWEAYPKKFAIGAAQKAWREINASAYLQIILAALQIQKDSDQWQLEEGRFIPHPANWLTDKRWQDEAAVISKEPVRTIGEIQERARLRKMGLL